jgi:dipeptidyl aminopeptidase/acylaminoacyl peptidase
MPLTKNGGMGVLGGMAKNQVCMPAGSRFLGTVARGATLGMMGLLFGLLPPARAANWEGAQLEETLLEPGSDPPNPGVSMAVATGRQGCRVAKLEGSSLDGYVVRVNGVVGPRWPEIAVETPVFSANGASVAYCARKGLDWRWVVNGVEGPVFPEMTPTSFAFSADGKRHAYVASPGFRRMVVAVDGVVGPEAGREVPQPWDSAPLFSPDGERLAYVEALHAERKMRVNLDGKPGAWYDGVSVLQSPGDGAHAMTGPRASVAGWALTRPRPRVFCMAFSVNGRSFGCHAEIGGRWAAVINGKQGALHDAMGVDLVFHAEGEDYAYMALDGMRRTIQRAKGPPMPVEAVHDGTLIFSPDGRSFAFAGVREGVTGVWLDGKAVPCDVKVAKLKNHGSVCFSPDSQRLAFAAETADSTLHWVVDGKAGPPASSALGTIDFSPDSTHYAHTQVAPGNKGIAIVEDRVVRAQYEAVPAGPVYLEDGRLEYLAVKGNDLYRCRVRR